MHIQFLSTGDLQWLSWIPLLWISKNSFSPILQWQKIGLYNQCCGSGSRFGSAWIRIHLAVLDPDPDPYRECGSGSGSRSMKIDQILQKDLIFCLSSYLCFFLLSTLEYLYFSCKNSTFFDFKVWPGFGSAWIRSGLAPWIRIRI